MIVSFVPCPLPIYHSFAFGFAIIAGLASGASIVIQRNFLPRQYLNMMVSEKATLSLLVPVMASVLSKTFLPFDVDLSALRYLIVGAGAIPENVFHSFKEKYGVSLSANYGRSETGGIITRIEPDIYPSIGTPMYGVDVRYVMKTINYCFRTV